MTTYLFNLQVFDEVPIQIERGGIDLIVGREYECNLLKRVAEMGSANILITGPFGIGKTTILIWAEKKAFSDYFTILIDGKKITNSEIFLYTIAKEINEKLLTNHSVDISPHSKNLAIGLAKELKSFRRGYEWEYKKIYRKLLDVLIEEELIEETKPLMVLVDDFALAGANKELERSWLKSFMSFETNIRLVVTMQTYMFSKMAFLDPALLSRFNPKISLRFLSQEEIKEIIRRRLKIARYGEEDVPDDWYPFTEDAVNLIAFESNGIPRKALYITKEILLSLINIPPDGELPFPITREMASTILRERSLDTYSYVLNELGEKAKLIHETLKKNGGCMKLKDLSTTLNMPEANVRYWLRKMIQEGAFIQKEKRGLYCLKVKTRRHSGEGF